MGRPPVTRDVHDPDFPHGQVRGYRRGCRGEVCGGACRAVCSQYQRDIRLSLNLRRQPDVDYLVPADEAAAHARALLAAHPDWVTGDLIAVAAGLYKRVVYRLLAGRPMLAVSSSRAILRVTVPLMRRKALMLPARWAVQRINSLRVQGWPTETILGRPMPRGWTRPGALIKRATFDQIDATYHRIGDRTGPSTSAALRARAQGWYPAICYDEDSRLITAAIRPDTPSLQQQWRARSAYLFLEVMRRTAEGDSIKTLAADIKMNPQTVVRYRRLAAQHPDQTAAALTQWTSTARTDAIDVVVAHRIPIYGPGARADDPQETAA